MSAQRYDRQTAAQALHAFIQTEQARFQERSADAVSLAISIGPKNVSPALYDALVAKWFMTEATATLALLRDCKTDADVTELTNHILEKKDQGAAERWANVETQNAVASLHIAEKHRREKVTLATHGRGWGKTEAARRYEQEVAGEFVAAHVTMNARTDRGLIQGEYDADRGHINVGTRCVAMVEPNRVPEIAYEVFCEWANGGPGAEPRDRHVERFGRVVGVILGAGRAPYRSWADYVATLRGRSESACRAAWEHEFGTWPGVDLKLDPPPSAAFAIVERADEQFRERMRALVMAQIPSPTAHQAWLRSLDSKPRSSPAAVLRKAVEETKGDLDRSLTPPWLKPRRFA